MNGKYNGTDNNTLCKLMAQNDDISLGSNQGPLSSQRRRDCNSATYPTP